MNQTKVTLHGGVKMPQIGFETYQIEKNETTKEACLSALKAECCYIYTIHAYMNEVSVGQTVTESGIAREKI